MTAHAAPPAITRRLDEVREMDVAVPEADLSLAPAPHDGLLMLAALTGNRRLLRAWLQVERTRERAAEDRAA